MAQSKVWTALPSWVIYPVGLIPAAYYFFAAFSNALGPDPAKALEHALGEWALRFLIAGLAITPLMRFARINLVKYRRAIGALPSAAQGQHEDQQVEQLGEGRAGDADPPNAEIPRQFPPEQCCQTQPMDEADRPRRPRRGDRHHYGLSL